MRVLLAMKFKNKTGFRVNSLIPVFLCGIIILTSTASWAQNSQTKGSKIDIPPTQLNFTLPSYQTGVNKALLDEKINPDTYILGPGDVLSIFAWGGFQGQYQLTISPEGMLLVPEIGPIDVADISLTEARQKIAESIREKYRNVESTISLVDLRVFKVYVGGAVVNPGAYPATAVTRASEVITLAGGFFEGPSATDKTSAPSYQYLYTWVKVSSKRAITVRRKNGQVLNADVLRLELASNPDFDPPLRDGDEIFVPLREWTINLYGIFGAIKNPGYFEYSSRDSLADLIDLGHGLTLDADSEKVEIVRFGDDNTSTHSITVDLRSNNWNIPLKPDDRVYVKPLQSYHEKYQVELIGEIKYPGYYAISEDSTTLAQIVAKAGGLTELASLEEAEMTRVSAEELVDPEFERLKKMNVADMSESEYDYFKIKSRSKAGRVAVNFRDLFEKHNLSNDVLLRNNDVINIPRKRQVVSVSGEVANPGFLTYIPDKDYVYYISMAGGYSDRAGKGSISIIKASGEWKSPKKGRSLEPGDTVWIPEKKKHNYIGGIKDLVTFIGGLATIYLVIRQATQ
jgi:protein involved in polysaccharide export with SLBB domain